MIQRKDCRICLNIVTRTRGPETSILVSPVVVAFWWGEGAQSLACMVLSASVSGSREARLHPETSSIQFS